MRADNCSCLCQLQKISHFPFLIIFEQIIQLWTCQYKHILILLWVFVTDNSVNSGHVSTAKSLCYMAPPALVSKCQPRKMGENVRPSHPHHHSTHHDILQILLILVTAIVNFLGSCNNLKFYWYTLTSVRTAFITNLQTTIFKGSYWYFAQTSSWVGAWTLLIMASLFPFSRILWNFEILWIHIDWCLSLDSLLPYSSHFFVYRNHIYHSNQP